MLLSLATVLGCHGLRQPRHHPAINSQTQMAASNVSPAISKIAIMGSFSLLPLCFQISTMLPCAQMAPVNDGEQLRRR
jgi:predicted membrane protein